MKIPNKSNPLGITNRDNLTFIALQPSTIKLTATGNPVTNGLQYRTDIFSDWQTYNIDDVINLNTGDKVQFRNIKNQLSLPTDEYVMDDYVNFEMTGSISASGNIQSMLNYSKSCKPYCYRSLFENCKSLNNIQFENPEASK